MPRQLDYEKPTASSPQRRLAMVAMLWGLCSGPAAVLLFIPVALLFWWSQSDTQALLTAVILFLTIEASFIVECYASVQLRRAPSGDRNCVYIGLAGTVLWTILLLLFGDSFHFGC